MLAGLNFQVDTGVIPSAVGKHSYEIETWIGGACVMIALYFNGLGPQIPLQAGPALQIM